MGDEVTGVSVRRAAQILDIPQRTANRLVTDGWVTPEGRSKATGRSSRYSLGPAGLRELVTVSQLRKYGFSTRSVKKAITTLRALSGLDRPLAEQLTLVVAGDDLTWVQGELAVSLLKHPAQAFLAIRVSDIYSDLIRRLRAEENAERMIEGCGVTKGHFLAGSEKHG